VRARRRRRRSILLVDARIERASSTRLARGIRAREIWVKVRFAAANARRRASIQQRRRIVVAVAVDEHVRRRHGYTREGGGTRSAPVYLNDK